MRVAILNQLDAQFSLTARNSNVLLNVGIDLHRHTFTFIPNFSTTTSNESSTYQRLA